MFFSAGNKAEGNEKNFCFGSREAVILQGRKHIRNLLLILLMSNPVYKIENLTKIYKNGHVLANDNICLEIPQGEVFGIFGPNGVRTRLKDASGAEYFLLSVYADRVLNSLRNSSPIDKR